MQKRAYTEAELRSNRASLMLHGGAELDRRAWAHNVSESWPEQGPFVEVKSMVELGPALARPNAVVYVQDIAALGRRGQMSVLNCLQHQEERPKIIVGMQRSPQELVDAGELRDDLVYRLSIAVVNLAHAETLTMLRNRVERRAAVVSRAAVAEQERAVKARAKAAHRASRR